MSYSLNNINLTILCNFIPGKQDKSNLALAGFMDMPARLGKCFNDNWKSIHGVEPYTSAEEIRFGGRDISLTGTIIGLNKDDLANKLKSLTDLINSFTGLVPLTSEKWGTFMVLVNEPISGVRIGQIGLRITIPMREPIVDLSGTLPASDGDMGFDGISFSALGGVLLSLDGDRWNRTAPKSQELTAWFNEGYRITKTEAPKLNMKVFLRQPTFFQFRNKVKGLYAIFSKPGERNMIIKDDLYRRVFACSGFKIKGLNSRNNSFYGTLEIELIQTGLASQLTYLGDNQGNIITDNLNNKILVL